jgi:hypothetical protein
MSTRRAEDSDVQVAFQDTTEQESTPLLDAERDDLETQQPPSISGSQHDEQPARSIFGISQSFSSASSSLKPIPHWSLQLMRTSPPNSSAWGTAAGLMVVG